jgi:PIN domain nuclease of toxin-antitoxin system
LVSAISYWESSLKISLEKLRVPIDFVEKLVAERFEDLPFSA